jgi:hypothetical protein
LDAVQAVTGKRWDTAFVDSKVFLREQFARWENKDDDGVEMAVALLGSSYQTGREKRPSRTSCSAWRRRIWKRRAVRRTLGQHRSYTKRER